MVSGLYNRARIWPWYPTSLHKERDKPMKLEKKTRCLEVEEKGKKLKLAPGPGDAAEEDESSQKMREKKIAFLKGVLEPSYGGEDIPDYL